MSDAVRTHMSKGAETPARRIEVFMVVRRRNWSPEDTPTASGLCRSFFLTGTSVDLRIAPAAGGKRRGDSRVRHANQRGRRGLANTIPRKHRAQSDAALREAGFFPAHSKSDRARIR
jgi:hypothetical protein